jgi:hypothetical protein
MDAAFVKAFTGALPESPAPVAAEQEGVTNTKVILKDNYPNPFNPTTRISYSLPQESFVTLKIYDAVGREIATLVNGLKSEGEYSVDFNAGSFASGFYFYKLEAGNVTQVKKMMLIK